MVLINNSRRCGMNILYSILTFQRTLRKRDILSEEQRGKITRSFTGTFRKNSESKTRRLSIMKQNRTKKTRFLVTFMLVAVALSTTCFAAEWLPWGPNHFTPYTGSIGAFSTYYSVSDLRWTEDQIREIGFDPGIGWKSLELECRPYSNNPGQDTTQVSADALWEYQGTDHLDIMTNLPNGYGEFQKNDPDDIAIVCVRLATIEPEEEYYGTIELDPKSGITFTNRRVLFESEYGRHPGEGIYDDSLPLKYEQLFNRNYDGDVVDADTYFGRYYDW